MDSSQTLQLLGPGTGMIRADNPSEMTLEGTNSYVLFAPSQQQPGPQTEVVLIDPGPESAAHLQALASFAVQLILVTHRHADHTAGIDTLHRLTGVPVRAVLPEHCRAAPVLHDGEIIEVAGVRLQVLATPGHTSDSVCFVREDAELFTGDTALGRGTTILDYPDGTLGDYLHSLDKLRALPPLALRPAHGQQHANSHPVLDFYIAHRQQRLSQLREAITDLHTAGQDPGLQALLARVYPEIDPRLSGAAMHSLKAQLHYLAENEGLVLP